MESTDSIEVQASVLAEKTVRISLEDLAQLCPEAEQIIENLLAIQQVSSEILLSLGLENQRELRAFVERVILKTSHSPQDLLAGYLYQGRAAIKAGVDPRDWNLRVHRPIRLVSARFQHYLSTGAEVPPALQALYGLKFDCIAQTVRELRQQLNPEDPGFKQSGETAGQTDTDALQQQIHAKLNLMPRIEFLLRKGAAMRLMRDALQSQGRPVPGEIRGGQERTPDTAPAARKTGPNPWGQEKAPRPKLCRIPLSGVNIEQARALQTSQA